MHDSHSSFDLHFRGKPSSPFAHRLERKPVPGSRWSASDTSLLLIKEKSLARVLRPLTRHGRPKIGSSVRSEYSLWLHQQKFDIVRNSRATCGNRGCRSQHTLSPKAFPRWTSDHRFTLGSPSTHRPCARASPQRKALGKTTWTRLPPNHRR